MNNVFDVFSDPALATQVNRYKKMGYPCNPFREEVEEQVGDTGPFYSNHINGQIQEIRQWLLDVYERSNAKPLALVGNVGAGKTRILKFLRKSIENAQDRHTVAAVMLLSDTGFTRASVGGAIVSALERTPIPWSPDNPDGSLPLIWAIVTSPSEVLNTTTPLRAALATAQKQSKKGKEEFSSFITRWLQRDVLNASESSRTGLRRRIDWEGELIRIIADLLRVAREVGVVSICYLFFDQIEDLFRPVFSDLRRSRILTDLRGLIDEIDAGAPIGVLLAWTPDFGTNTAFRNARLVERQFQQSYEALYSRLQQRRVDLDLLKLGDAEPFARAWIDALRNDPDYVRRLQPDLEDLVENAWASLKSSRGLYPGDVATPRDLLSALADEVDKLLE